MKYDFIKAKEILKNAEHGEIVYLIKIFSDPDELDKVANCEDVAKLYADLLSDLANALKEEIIKKESEKLC